MNRESCLYCGKSLEGMRNDAKYCSPSHNVLDCIKRKKLGVKEEESRVSQ